MPYLIQSTVPQPPPTTIFIPVANVKSIANVHPFFLKLYILQLRLSEKCQAVKVRDQFLALLRDSVDSSPPWTELLTVRLARSQGNPLEEKLAARQEQMERLQQSPTLQRLVFKYVKLFRSSRFPLHSRDVAQA